jgi:signal peptidase II
MGNELLHTALVLLLSFVAIAAFILSWGAKILADVFLVHRIAIVGSLVGLEPSFNPGIAFGILFPAPLQHLLVGAALLLVFFFAWRTARTRLAMVAFGLILGGALENIVDRLGDGVVTDFFQVGTFPIFNVADSCITIGVLLLLIDTLRRSPR